MANPFQTVSVRRPAQNTFKLGHDVKFTTSMGTLTPIFLSECLPGDSFSLSSEVLIRMAPLLAPVMHNVNVSVHYFFVPNRILWPNWEDFISPDLSKETPPAWCHLKGTDVSPTGAVLAGSLPDYLGLPAGTKWSSIDTVSALPFAGYQAIWNEFYRDQNLQTEVDYKLTNGKQIPSKVTGLIALRKRAWSHDYFTSALPFAQKGPAVNLPMDFDGVSAPLRTNGTGGEIQVGLSGRTWVTSGTAQEAGPNVPYENSFINPKEFNLQNATTINDFRVALQLQTFFEKAARGGSRYIEQIKMHFATTVPDFRLDRPEFIGGTQAPVIISEVLQTSGSATTPQATMAGHGISANSGRNMRYHCKEHGYIFGIMSVMPATAYSQGIPKHFQRQDWDDYAWPTFAHLGEQPILNKEIYVGEDGKNDDTFGYIPRYSEYRYMSSRIAGDFRTSLEFWHLGRKFDTRPNLNAQFIEADPSDRIFAVKGANKQNLWCHAFNKVFVRRSLPKYGTPTL